MVGDVWWVCGCGEWPANGEVPARNVCGREVPGAHVLGALSGPQRAVRGPRREGRAAWGARRGGVAV